ncbi:hypothetical protein LWM68_39700 [Niabella sp. W65]|nr:hypothetical protein [Niabella sp. W65]MCH7368323.1 hypothetical protein [Niabella sp. W65]ULT43921.1 hypothetical protein KRR40_11365 [Niabella sp. I65]
MQLLASPGVEAKNRIYNSMVITRTPYSTYKFFYSRLFVVGQEEKGGE